MTPQETTPLKMFPVPGTSAPAWPVIDPSASIVGAFAALHADRFKVSGLVADVVISAEEAKSEAKIESQPFVHAPVVLEVWLDDFVTVVVLRLGRSLRERGHLPVRRSAKAFPVVTA